MKPELDVPSLQSMEGHLQTSMDVWVDNNKKNNILDLQVDLLVWK